MEGYLEKRQMVRSHRRYFRLDGATLSYSDTPDSATKGIINLRQAQMLAFEDPYRRITIRGKNIDTKKPNKERYVLVAGSQSDYVRWRGTIRRARASSAAAVVSWTTSFSALVESFRRCVREAVEASILDLSEYSEADFASLQERHAAHSRSIQLQTDRRRRGSVTGTDGGHSSSTTVGNSAGHWEDAGSSVVPLRDILESGGGAFHSDVVFDPLGSGSSAPLTPAADPLVPAGELGGARRKLALPAQQPLRRTTNPLHQGGREADAVDRILGGHRTPPPAATEAPQRRPLLQIPVAEQEFATPIVPPKPGTVGKSFAARRDTNERFTGPAWHYLDVLNHAGGILSSVQYIAKEAELSEFWEMYATTHPGVIIEDEHRAILAHLVDEVKGTLPAMLDDIVAVVLRAYGVGETEEHAKAVRASMQRTIAQLTERFHDALKADVPGMAAEMWAALDTERKGRVGRARFVDFYLSRPIVPSSSLVDVTLDEVGSQIQRQLMRRAATASAGDSDDGDDHKRRQAAGAVAAASHGAASAPRLGDCGLDNLGNTCYMNSALQCLAHAPLFRQHLLLGKHRAPHRGTAMPICDSLADLFRVMFDGKTSRVSPHSVRKSINAHTKDFFAGITQHDAQELLAAVIDGVHEEMNTGKRGKYEELPDDPSRPDAELADAWWQAHQRVHQSPIVDWFHGQQKSRRECSVCGHPSLSYDAFSILTAPIPGAADQDLPPPRDFAADVDWTRDDLNSSDDDDDAASVRSESSDHHGTPPRPKREGSFSDSFESVDGLTSGGAWLTVPFEDSPPRLVRRAGGRPQSGQAVNSHAATASKSTAERDDQDAVDRLLGGAPAPKVVPFEECVDELFAPEKFEAHCSKCKKITPATRQATLWRAPYYLTVGLKRFRHDPSGALMSRNGAKVRVPARLDVSRWLDPHTDGGVYVSGAAPPSVSATAIPSPLYSGVPSKDASCTSVPVSPRLGAPVQPAVPGSPTAPAPRPEYELFGVIRHSGWISGGHYTASCLSEGRWMLYNDGMVAPDRPESFEADDGVYVALYRLRRS
jgi:ubiquitin C-terminal hydrolase